jgi:hypothetical protein
MGADDRLVRDMGCKSSRGERDQLALQPRGPTTGQKHQRLASGRLRDGLATATAERVVAGNRTIEIARVRITEAGRRALAPI